MISLEIDRVYPNIDVFSLLVFDHNIIFSFTLILSHSFSHKVFNERVEFVLHANLGFDLVLLSFSNFFLFNALQMIGGKDGVP